MSVIARLGQTRQDPDVVAANKTGMAQQLKHPKPPKLANERTGLNDEVANLIAKTVGSMWMFYASIIGFAVWMAGLGVTVAGDNYPYNLMLLAVGGIMQWLAMIAILVAQNAQGNVQDNQVEHHPRAARTSSTTSAGSQGGAGAADSAGALLDTGASPTNAGQSEMSFSRRSRIPKRTASCASSSCSAYPASSWPAR